MNVMTINFCHRDFPINYGQTLLGYALYKNIQRLGHNPIAVSYTERDQNMEKWYLARLLTPDKRTFASKSFAKTTEFIRNNMNFIPCFSKKEVYKISELCDAWIVGGDVVWRKGYLGEIFTLDFGSPSKRRISYSPSMYGYNKEDECFFKAEMSKIKRNIDFVSFREESSVKIYNDLTGEDSFNAIDPVLLEEKENWLNIAKPMSNITSNYILIYIFGNPEEYNNLIESLKIDNSDKQIVIIPTTEKWAEMFDVNDPIGVEEFVWLFNNADIIITNSFHGTAFALEFEKQFYVCGRANMVGEGKDFRISELLKKVGIADNRDYCKKTLDLIDYTIVSREIEKWRKASLDYLQDALVEDAELHFPQVYAVKNKNDEIRKMSSSGGVFYELAMAVINDGGIVFGADWNERFDVNHVAANSEEDVKKLMRSKYVQSHMDGVYDKVRTYLESGIRVLFTGTPCQIYGLRKYLNNQFDEKLICVGIICHGVPKNAAWRKYLSLLEEKYGKTKEVTFRDKTNGWKDWKIRICFEDEEYIANWQDDSYYTDFLKNDSLLESCFACNSKYHLKNLDMIIGDFWRYESKEDNFDDDKGLSAVIVLTRVGERIWNNIESQFKTEKSDFKTLSNLQWHLEHSAIKTS